MSELFNAIFSNNGLSGLTSFMNQIIACLALLVALKQ